MLADATVLRNVLADELDATIPEFRRIPNLFEIVTFDYSECELWLGGRRRAD